MATLPMRITMPKPAKPLPAPNSDFYELAETLPAEELAVVKQVRTFMETEVAPIITKHWIADEFPFELLPAIKELNIGGAGMKGYGCRGGSGLLFGLLPWRWPAATFRSLHSSVYTMAWQWAPFISADRKSRGRNGSLPWRAGKIGCFGLTEPL